MPIAIDFETYYDKGYSLKLLAPEVYCAHEKFDPYLVSLKGHGIEYVGSLSNAPWQHIRPEELFVAHNARFDSAVFEAAQAKGLIPNNLKPEWACTADMSAFLRGGRSLSDASKNLLGKTVDKKFRDKMERLGYSQMLVLGLKEELYKYALGDAISCFELWTLHSASWPMFERSVSRINLLSGRRGVAVDSERLRSGLALLATAKWEAAKGIPWDWEENRTPLSPSQLMSACLKEGIPCPKSVAEDSEECKAWEEQYGAKYPWIENLRRWRKAHGLETKLRRLQENLLDGIYPFQLKYFGASTGRFSGAGGFNMQNMINGDREGVNLRSLFIPRSGYRLLAPDYAQIEARILLWLVKDTDTLDMVRNGMSIYEAHARQTLGWKGGKLKDENPDLYGLAKARCLGLGYGAGAAKFQWLASSWGVHMDAATAEDQVARFRLTNPKITNAWAMHNRNLKWCAQAGESYNVELPSGRELVYGNPKATSRGIEAQFEINGNFYKTYGGLVVENICQAIARDVMCEGLVRLSNMGLRVLFTVHDEIILEVPESITKDELEDIRKALCTSPDWISGCPFGIDMKLLERYE